MRALIRSSLAGLSLIIGTAQLADAAAYSVPQQSAVLPQSRADGQREAALSAVAPSHSEVTDPAAGARASARLPSVLRGNDLNWLAGGGG